MSGLEIAGVAVPAAIELIKATHSTLKFIHDVRRTSKQDAEQGDMHFQLEVQAIQFERWCEALKLREMIRIKESNPDTWTSSSEFKNLRKTLSDDLRFGNGTMADLTLKTLASLRDRLEEAWKVLQDYQPYPSQSTPIEKPAPPKEKKSWFRRSASSSRKDLQVSESAKASHSSLLTTAKWVALDRAEFQRLLTRITELNTSLLTLLGPQTQHSVHRQSEMKILDDSNPQLLSASIASEDDLAVLVKLRMLQLSDSMRPLTTGLDNNPFRIHIYSMADFQGEVNATGPLRSTAQLDGASVLIEWRNYSHGRSVLQQTTRLSNLIGLLNHNYLYERFSAPKCKGLVDDPAKLRVGLAFVMPSTNVNNTPSAPFQDLRTFIKATSKAIPSVGARFAISKTLAAAMSSLHAVKWLHKSFRSDNIVFAQEPLTRTSLRTGRPGEANAATGMESLSIAPPPLPQVFVVGWDLSRPDDPSEYTESLSVTDDNVKLYSHPDTHRSQASDGSRTRFRMQFDIYSLGLVLLEIGLWYTLSDLRARCQSDDEFRRRVRDDYCDKLQAKMGDVYWRATQRCLANDFDLDETDADSQAGASNGEEYRLQSAFEQQVVAQLAMCMA